MYTFIVIINKIYPLQSLSNFTNMISILKASTENPRDGVIAFTNTSVIDNTMQSGATLPEHKQQNAGKYLYANFHGPKTQHQENKFAKVASNHDNNTSVLQLMGHLEREKRQARNCFRRRCRQVSLNRKISSII